jgi:hypothetical protein
MKSFAWRIQIFVRQICIKKESINKGSLRLAQAPHDFTRPVFVLTGPVAAIGSAGLLLGAGLELEL